MDLLISCLHHICIFRYLIFMCYVFLLLIHCMLFHILVSSSLFFDDRSLDILFQLMFVCFYQWNIFLWYISIGGKYLKWKNHIDPFILNKIIIGSSHILSFLSLNISISFFMCYVFLLFIHCMLFHILVSSSLFFDDQSLTFCFNLCLFVFIDGIYFYDILLQGVSI